MATVSANYGFTVNDQNGKHTFIYQQEKYRGRNLIPIIFGLALISLFIAVPEMANSIGKGIFVWLLFTIGGFFLIKYLFNVNRKQRQFTIAQTAIEVDGRHYDRKHITSMYVQEGQAQTGSDINFNQGAVIAYRASPGGYIAASATNAGHAAGALVGASGKKLRENMAKLNSKIMMRYGNKKIELAKGITVDTAELMLEKIKETLS